MTYKEWLEAQSKVFKAANIETSRLDAEIILQHVTDLSKEAIIREWETPLTKEQTKTLTDLCKRRERGEPVAYLTEEKDFYGRAFLVNKSVLVPRPETEGLVERGLEFLRPFGDGQPVKIVDLGTGSACLAVTMACEMPKSRLMAIDRSPEAIGVAKKNAETHNTLVQIDFGVGDVANYEWPRDWQGEVDLVLANPPYIAFDDQNIQASVKEHEPNIALFAEENGGQCLRKWSLVACELLRSGGLAVFEIGAEQGTMVTELSKKMDGIGDWKIEKDYGQMDRYWIFRKS